ncbi:MAG: hypothetical protein WCV84_04300 [Patescibacteria group bacterium]
MKKLLTLLALTVLLGVGCIQTQTAKPTKDDIETKPPINTANTAGEVVEIMQTSCTTDDECTLPMEYAIRSNCPYKTSCHLKKCTVICPTGFTHPKPLQP